MIKKGELLEWLFKIGRVEGNDNLVNVGAILK